MGKEFKVSDQYRTNPMSHTPGGTEVKVHYQNGQCRIYDKVKYPRKYIGSLAKRRDANDVIKIEVHGEVFWERTEKDQTFF